MTRTANHTTRNHKALTAFVAMITFLLLSLFTVGVATAQSGDVEWGLDESIGVLFGGTVAGNANVSSGGYYLASGVYTTYGLSPKLNLLGSATLHYQNSRFNFSNATETPVVKVNASQLGLVLKGGLQYRFDQEWNGEVQLNMGVPVSSSDINVTETESGNQQTLPGSGKTGFALGFGVSRSLEQRDGRMVTPYLTLNLDLTSADLYGSSLRSHAVTAGVRFTLK